ncbi:hypothetical protein D3C72_992060 [compost metagenome]
MANLVDGAAGVGILDGGDLGHLPVGGAHRVLEALAVEQGVGFGVAVQPRQFDCLVGDALGARQHAFKDVMALLVVDAQQGGAGLVDGKV